jgi:hypothetical protein
MSLTYGFRTVTQPRVAGSWAMTRRGDEGSLSGRSNVLFLNLFAGFVSVYFGKTRPGAHFWVVYIP